MALNRTISESKDDLKAAADALKQTFRATFLVQPTEIESNELPLFSVLDGVEADELEEVDTLETQYSARYEFDIVMVFKRDCLESEVIAGRNAYVSKLIDLQQAAGTRPFRIEDRHRIFTGHWGMVEGWFVEMTFSRFVIEDFS